MLREAEATETIKEMSMDSATEYLSAEMTEALRTLGPNENGVTIHVKPPGRESRQDIADLDSKMCIFSRALMNIRRNVRPKTLAWKPYIAEALDFVNKKRIRHGRAMGLAPNKAQASFEAAKEGRSEKNC